MKLAELYAPQKRTVAEGKMKDLEYFLEQDIKLEPYQMEEAMEFLNATKDFDELNDNIQVKFEAWFPDTDYDHPEEKTDGAKVREAVLKALQ